MLCNMQLHRYSDREYIRTFRIMVSPNNRVNVTATHKSAGFTLIEVVVALLVMTLGILGVAAMQFKGMQFNQDAFMRSQVSFLAYDLIDRVRVNKDNRTQYVFSEWTVDAATLASFNCPGVTVTTAVQDRECWQKLAAETLPQEMKVELTNTADQFTLFFRWTDREGNARTIDYSFEVTSV